MNHWLFIGIGVFFLLLGGGLFFGEVGGDAVSTILYWVAAGPKP